MSHLLTEHCASTVALIGSARSVREDVAVIEDLQPDPVFLDVQIHDKTGFDLLKSLDSFPFYVLFHNLTTSQNAAGRIAVPVATGLVFLSISNIIRCQSDSNYTLIF